MIRRIIAINEALCNGCGLCAAACHEGAIGMIDGKARLLREDYCDGLGDCLPACPTGAITFVEREAAAYDEIAVNAVKATQSGGCPGTACQSIPCSTTATFDQHPSQLTNWPVQIKLAPINAPYFHNADLLIAADCTAYAHGGFHPRFVRGKVTLIGCPKLDSIDYSDKLTQIFMQNDIRSITVTRMTVPCCGGLPYAVQNALKASGKDIPLSVVTIDLNGKIISA